MYILGTLNELILSGRLTLNLGRVIVSMVFEDTTFSGFDTVETIKLKLGIESRAKVGIPT